MPIATRRAKRCCERAEAVPAGTITPEYFVSRLRAAQSDDMLFVNEAISNYGVVFDHLRLDTPGTISTSGGGSLGWNGGGRSASGWPGPMRRWWR
jgi:acetolactate synthase-1/2/3 large subunit